MRVPERSRGALVAVSTGQLACGLAGLAIALRRRHPYHVLFLRGSRETVGRDALWVGTALSAPAPMLVTQAAAATLLATRDSARARAVLGVLGAAMVPGYLGERLVRRRLTRRGFEMVETPLVVVGIGLSASMAGTLFGQRASGGGRA